MKDLQALYESLGFSDVRTFIQSGNVLFRSDAVKPLQVLSDKIEKAIKAKYDFDVPVIIRTSEEMKSILSSNPFLTEDNIDTDKLHLTFLDTLPSTEKVKTLTETDYSPDRFFIMGKDIYLYCPGGYRDTKLSNNLFEKKLQVKATTRNWRTARTLTEMGYQK